jgi:hypothetical protein
MFAPGINANDPTAKRFTLAEVSGISVSVPSPALNPAKRGLGAASPPTEIGGEAVAVGATTNSTEERTA